MKTVYHSCAFFFIVLTITCATQPAKSGCFKREKALTLLEIAEDLLSKANNSYPSCKEDVNSTGQSECSKKKSLVYIELSKNLVSEVRENFPTGSDPIVPEKKKTDKPRDCSEILASGHNESGVYTIWLEEQNATLKQLKVYCDMATNEGGWTVIQRRGKFPVQQDFFQDWETYMNGFGNIKQEFWLGNENIQALCRNECKLRIDLQDKSGMKRFAVYQSFSIRTKKYFLNISGYSGNAGDSFGWHNEYEFHTKDKGFIERPLELKGGWWYGGFYHCDLNGVYKPGKTNDIDSVHWHEWHLRENLAAVEMKVKPN